MRVCITLISLLLAATAARSGERVSAEDSPGATGAAGATGEKPRLAIRALKEAEWKCDIADVEKVLYSTAGELVRYFPERKLPVIEVRAKGGPIALFERGPQGQIQVRLDTGQQLWAQMAFQFAHEMGHVLCNYDADEHRQKWFEESLCELASLAALRRMAETWSKTPPYPNWKSYAPHLKSYAQERLDKAVLPPGVTLAKWYEENSVALQAKATDRERNLVVGACLLPIFEAAPEKWEAVSWLNTERLTKLHTFKDYLEAWRRNCPDRHKEFVRGIARQFGIELEP